MQLSQSSPSQTILLSGIILALLGIGGSYEFLLPRLQTANAAFTQANAQLAADTQNLSSLQSAKTQVDKVNSLLTAQGVDVSRVQEILPNTESMPGLYIQMESLAAQASDTIGSPVYQLGTPIKSPTTGAVQIPITVSGNGQYADIKNFLTMFETNIRPVSFTQVSLAVASATSTPGTTPTSSSTTPTAPPKGPVTVNATGYISALGLSTAFATPTK